MDLSFDGAVFDVILFILSVVVYFESMRNECIVV